MLLLAVRTRPHSDGKTTEFYGRDVIQLLTHVPTFRSYLTSPFPGMQHTCKRKKPSFLYKTSSSLFCCPYTGRGYHFLFLLYSASNFAFPVILCSVFLSPIPQFLSFFLLFLLLIYSCSFMFFRLFFSFFLFHLTILSLEKVTT